MVFESDLEAELRRRAKAQIRKRMRALRSTIPPSALAERSARIVARIAQSAPFRRAAEVALFDPMLSRGEVDIRELDGVARAAAKKVAYPALVSESWDMVFRRAERADLSDRGHGFGEPPEQAPLVEPHAELLIIVPALALDSRGHRVGYGAGCYDRALAASAPPATTLAVAYDFQMLAEVPADEWDRPVDWVTTDQTLFAVAPAGHTP